MRHAFSLCAALTLVSSPILAAETQKTIPAQLSSAKAYVLVRMGERSPGLWNLVSIAAFDSTVENLRGKGRAKANAVPKGADKSVIIGPKNQIDEADHTRTYLTTITPGTYVIASSPTTCFCLGSYAFEAKAGIITDLGTIYMGPENGSSSWADLASLRSSPDIEERGYTVADAMVIYAAGAKTALPAGLGGLPRTSAAYVPVQRFGNHSGQLLNRALPLKDAK